MPTNSPVASGPDDFPITCLRGSQVAGVLRALADLRLTIFLEFPYLYQGVLEDELRYLEHYVTAPDALVITVTDKGRVVGAATGIPLRSEVKELVEPVSGSSYAVDEIYYVGELLFYREFRNRGLGLKLLAQVEEQVRSLGPYRYLACATVQRPEDHPARPADYLPIERFLNRTGFQPLDHLETSFTWRETDGKSRPHPMKFWIKKIG